MLKFMMKRSGDSECECWLVDRETFIQIRGCNPNEFDTHRYADENDELRYMIYPLDLIIGCGFNWDDNGPYHVSLNLEHPSSLI